MEKLQRDVICQVATISRPYFICPYAVCKGNETSNRLAVHLSKAPVSLQSRAVFIMRATAPIDSQTL